MTTDELADVFNIVAQGAKTIDCDSFLDVMGYEEPDRDDAAGPDRNIKPATQKRRQEKERQCAQMQSALVTVIGSEDELTSDERWGLKFQKLFDAVATPTQAAYDRATMMGVSKLIMHETACCQGKAAHLLRIQSILHEAIADILNATGIPLEELPVFDPLTAEPFYRLASADDVEIAVEEGFREIYAEPPRPDHWAPLPEPASSRREKSKQKKQRNEQTKRKPTAKDDRKSSEKSQARKVHMGADQSGAPSCGVGGTIERLDGTLLGRVDAELEVYVTETGVLAATGGWRLDTGKSVSKSDEGTQWKWRALKGSTMAKNKVRSLS